MDNYLEKIKLGHPPKYIQCQNKFQIGYDSDLKNKNK